MKQKRIWIVLCLTCLVASAIAIGIKATGSQSHHINHPLQYPTQPASHTAPEYVVYWFVFHNVTRNNERTRELQAQGRARQGLHYPLQREAGLTQGQAQALSQIAAACTQEVKQQDERAQIVIRAFRAQLPPGNTAPPPPPELRTMWEERNAMVLRCRDRLRLAFGEEAFTSFDNFAKFRYGTNTAPVPVNPVRAASN